MRDDRFEMRLPPELKSQVQEEADNQQRSKAWIVIEALKQYLSKKREQK